MWLLLDNTEDLSIEAPCEAICIESDNVWPTTKTIPSIDQILRWLGCLVRLICSRVVSPSHFAVVELLSRDLGNVESVVARQYQVCPEHKSYIVKICLWTLMNSQLHFPMTNIFDDQKALVIERLLCEHVASALSHFLFRS